MFVSFDGVDGVGKSTQLKRFCHWLAELGFDVVTCRDPGSTPLGERLRDLLLERHQIAIDPRSEMLLYMAARAQLVEEVIRPALAAGQAVVSDRYLLANVVYQGHAGGLNVDQVWQVGRVATDELRPDVTVVLDMDCRAAAERMSGEPDRMESRGDDYRERVRRGFLEEARRDPDQIVVVNADQSVDDVERAVRDAVRDRCGELAP